MHPKSKEYKALQAEWDAKLKRSGFEDHEQRDGNLKRWHAHDLPARLSSVKFQVQADYYRSAGMFLHEHTFDSEIERAVWELHAAGATLREIPKQLKSSKVRTKWKAHQIIQKLTKIMVAKWRT